MIPNPYFILAGVLIVIASFGTGYYKGYSAEHEKFVTFQSQVEAVARAAQDHNEELSKQHSLVTEGIKNEYQAQLAAVHNYYADRVQYPSGNNVSSVPKPSAGTTCPAPDTVFIRQCAETTAQLNALQNWILKIK